MHSSTGCFEKWHTCGKNPSEFTSIPEPKDKINCWQMMPVHWANNSSNGYKIKNKKETNIYFKYAIDDDESNPKVNGFWIKSYN